MQDLFWPIRLAERYNPMAHEPEEQASINAGIFQFLGPPKALNRYLPREQGVCAETSTTSRVYLQVVVNLAFVPLACKWG